MENKKEIKTKNVIQRCGADRILPLTIVYIFYIILHGHLSPGGGFQGGVLMVAVAVLIYFGHGYETTLRAVHPHFLHGAEGFMSILYIAAAMLGVAYLGNFCQNVIVQMGDFGSIGDLLSSGTIFIMDSIVGLKVLTGVGVLAVSMLGLLMADGAENTK